MKIYNALIVSLGLLIILIGSLHFLGKNRDFKTRKHPGLENLANKVSSDKRHDWKQQNIIPYVYAVVKEEQLHFMTNKEEVPKAVLATNIPKQVFIEILSDVKKVNFLLNQWIQKYSLQDKVILYSRNHNVIINIRNVAPRWLTAFSNSEINKCIILNKIFLSSYCDYDASFLFIKKDASDAWIHDLPYKTLAKRKIWIVSENEEVLRLYPYTILKL